MRGFVFGSAFLCASLLFANAAAHAQQQRGLVNVNVSDVTVQIPVAVAANLCGVNVNVLAAGLIQGPTDCQAGAIALAADQNPDGGSGHQNGLINVNVTDVTAQVPISLAANICGVNVNVLVQLLAQGPVDCTAFGRSAAVFQ